ncbi:hypothetical protein niasHS_009947 [Heterodera schachtii]|uniref:Uncharacterized protein n=1 Tax=Heterodera schachtii TaxID=97005 RepID=A0ABD2JD04_HETSC
MNFPICLLLSLLFSFAICGKNDKKKATVDNDNKNSVPTMTKALRMLTKILAVQSVIGLANGSAPHAGQPTNVADQKPLHNSVDQIMSQPPSQSPAADAIGIDANSDYTPATNHPPIHNNKNN